MFQHGPNLAQLGPNLGPKTRPKGAPRPLPRATFNGKPKTSFFATLPWFCLIFGVQEGPWETKFRWKNDVSKQHVFQECCETRFSPTCSNISPTWAPRWPQEGGPRGANEPLFLSLCWLLGPSWAKMAPRAPQEPPRAPKTPSKPRFLKVFGALFLLIFFLFFYWVLPNFCRDFIRILCKML